MASTAIPPFAQAKQTSSVSHYRKAKDFPRPDFPVGTRLLFQGDSITDMKWGRNQADRLEEDEVVRAQAALHEAFLPVVDERRKVHREPVVDAPHDDFIVRVAQADGAKLVGS